MTVGAVVPAAGRGNRFGSDENKIWANILGKPVLAWTLEALSGHPCIQSLVVVAAERDRDRIVQLSRGLSKAVSLAEGGSTRVDSVRNGLGKLPPDCDLVLVHDAARPLVSHHLITTIVAEAERFGAAIPGLPLNDTVKRVGLEGSVEQTVNRDELRIVQTPQAARREWLEEAYRKLDESKPPPTDEAALLEGIGKSVRIVPGDAANIKLTTPEDIERIERLLASRTGGPETSPEFRTGFGYDVHRFGDNRPLWLGCVRIPHERGLLGHSDADVVAHAICDALLGAACLGDIGKLYPDTDAAHKDRSSAEFLADVAQRLGALGWRIAHIDVTLLAEKPRIAPYRQAMAEGLGDALGLESARVNLKATTSEGMGFVGRAEGIACWAVATIRR